MEIFGPFGVQMTVRFLRLWFENANDFLKKTIQKDDLVTQKCRVEVLTHQEEILKPVGTY